MDIPPEEGGHNHVIAKMNQDQEMWLQTEMTLWTNSWFAQWVCRVFEWLIWPPVTYLALYWQFTGLACEVSLQF